MPLVTASLMFVAAGASAAYWAMPWIQAPSAPVAAASKAAVPPPAIEAAAGLFGGEPAVAATAFQLKGVIADGPSGVALVGAEGKQTVAVGVGQEAAPGVTVREIHQTWVLLDEGGTSRRLELPVAASAGLEIVTAPPPGQPDAPAHALPARMAVAPVAKSGGAMPLPVADPNAVVAPGQLPPQLQGTPPEQVDRMRHRPAGIGPAAFGAKPQT